MVAVAVYAGYAIAAVLAFLVMVRMSRNGGQELQNTQQLVLMSMLCAGPDQGMGASEEVEHENSAW